MGFKIAETIGQKLDYELTEFQQSTAFVVVVVEVLIQNIVADAGADDAPLLVKNGL